jgi:hypothetical protein
MTEATNDMAVLFPGRDVTCKGETIRVVPLYFGQYPMAGKLAKPLVAALRESNLFTIHLKDAAGQMLPAPIFTLSPGWMVELPGLLDDGGEALMKFFAFAIGKPREWFDTLPGDEGIELAQAILEENKRFFIQKVLPLIKLDGLFKGTPADGAASSPDSSTSATAGATSN